MNFNYEDHRKRSGSELNNDENVMPKRPLFVFGEQYYQPGFNNYSYDYNPLNQMVQYANQPQQGTSTMGYPNYEDLNTKGHQLLDLSLGSNASNELKRNDSMFTSPDTTFGSYVDNSMINQPYDNMTMDKGVDQHNQPYTQQPDMYPQQPVVMAILPPVIVDPVFPYQPPIIRQPRVVVVPKTRNIIPTDSQPADNRSVAQVFGRLSTAGPTKKYHLRADEIRRRCGTPEYFNSSLLNCLFRKAKRKNGQDDMRNRLHDEFGIDVRLSSRQGLAATKFTPLLEDEAEDFAKDIDRVTKRYNPREGLAMATIASMQKNRYRPHEIAKCFDGFIRTMERIQNIVSKTNPPTNGHEQKLSGYPEMDADYNRFSLRTHGFGQWNERTMFGELHSIGTFGYNKTNEMMNTCMDIYGYMQFPQMDIPYPMPRVGPRKLIQKLHRYRCFDALIPRRKTEENDKKKKKDNKQQ